MMSPLPETDSRSVRQVVNVIKIEGLFLFIMITLVNIRRHSLTLPVTRNFGQNAFGNECANISEVIEPLIAADLLRSWAVL